MKNTLLDFITNATNETSITLSYAGFNNKRITKAIEINSLLNELGSEKLAFILNLSLNDDDKLIASELTNDNLQNLIEFFHK